jgi:hypothetical protein
MMESGLVGSTYAHSSGRGTARAKNAQGTPAQSRISPSILVYEEHREFSSRRISPSILEYTKIVWDHGGILSDFGQESHK